MEWQIILLLVVGGVIFLMMTGMPVAVAFLVVNTIGVVLLWGGGTGIKLLVLSMGEAVINFTLLALILFTLMGEVLFQSGIAPLMMDAVDKWLGRLPGRLGLEAVVGGTILSTLTGSHMASVAILGSSLVPEMEKRGYKKPMSLGPILGAGGLAIMIPPSGTAVFLAALAMVSVGKLLIAIIIPGILMAILYAGYIIIRSWLQPSIAPPYDVAHVPLSEKIMATVRYILPVGFIVFMVTGVIFLGIATPTEAAATGAVGTIILAVFYKRLNWRVMKKSTMGSIRIIGMMLLIIVGSNAFSQILAFSGTSRGLVEFMLALPVAPIMVIILMQVILGIMGTFMGTFAIMMITIPLFMPIVNSLGFDPIWFAVIYLLNGEMATTTPPYGMSLFVMKGVAPADTTMGDIFKAGLPFLGCDLIAMVLMFVFPSIALWLPNAMR